MVRVRRTSIIVLLFAFTTIATGLGEYLHDGLPSHDETNCSVQAALHAPTSAAPVVPVLISIGLFLAFLTELSRPLVSRRVPLRLDCRGPPARTLSI